MADPEPLEPDGVNYGGCNDEWAYQPCLYGDLILENSWRMTDGLYWNTEVGLSPADIF